MILKIIPFLLFIFSQTAYGDFKTRLFEHEKGVKLYALSSKRYVTAKTETWKNHDNDDVNADHDNDDIIAVELFPAEMGLPKNVTELPNIELTELLTANAYDSQFGVTIHFTKLTGREYGLNKVSIRVSHTDVTTTTTCAPNQRCNVEIDGQTQNVNGYIARYKEKIGVVEKIINDNYAKNFKRGLSLIDDTNKTEKNAYLYKVHANEDNWLGLVKPTTAEEIEQNCEKYLLGTTETHASLCGAAFHVKYFEEENEIALLADNDKYICVDQNPLTYRDEGLLNADCTLEDAASRFRVEFN